MKLFSRLLLAIIAFALLSLLLTSCYTKKRAIEKFCVQDSATATILVHDTVIVERVIADTVFSASIDSVVVTKDRLVITYKKVFDKIYLTGECKGDTIYKVKEVTVTIPCNCPPPPTDPWWYWIIKALAIIGALAVIIVSVRFFMK